MFKVLLLVFSSVFSIQLMAQDQPIEPPPPPYTSGVFQVQLASFDPKAPSVPPTDPADAGDLLIYVDIRGETLTITDGRGVGLILASDWRVVGDSIDDGRGVGLILVLGDEQGKVVNPNFGTDRIDMTCEEALEFLTYSLGSQVINVGLKSELSSCELLQMLIGNLKYKAEQQQQVKETGTLL